MSVLICGAGPTGLVTALVLTANGVPCRVIEKHTGPRASSRALGLQARSMEILSGLGVADEIARVSYRLTGAAIMRGTKKLTQMDWIPPSSPYPHTYVLPQSGLERILRTHVSQQGGRSRMGHRTRRGGAWWFWRQCASCRRQHGHDTVAHRRRRSAQPGAGLDRHPVPPGFDR